MSLRPRIASALSLLLALSSCTSREDAAAALKEAEAAITAQHADAIRYAPDAFKEINE